MKKLNYLQELKKITKIDGPFKVITPIVTPEKMNYTPHVTIDTYQLKKWLKSYFDQYSDEKKLHLILQSQKKNPLFKRKFIDKLLQKVFLLSEEEKDKILNIIIGFKIDLIKENEIYNKKH